MPVSHRNSIPFMHITGAGGVALNVEYSLADSVRPALKLNLKQHKTLFGR